MDSMIQHLTDSANQIIRGNYDAAKRLFALTNHPSAPRNIQTLAVTPSTHAPTRSAPGSFSNSAKSAEASGTTLDSLLTLGLFSAFGDEFIHQRPILLNLPDHLLKAVNRIASPIGVRLQIHDVTAKPILTPGSLEGFAPSKPRTRQSASLHR